MSSMSVTEMSRLGLYIGVGTTVIPATVTFLIASSRAIFINVIANTILRILTAGKFGIKIHGLSLIQVPFLWKISRISAVIGGSITALSIVAALSNTIYLRVFAK